MKNLTLKEKWGVFLGIVLSPGTLIFTVLTVISLWLSYQFRLEASLSTLLAILGSFFGGVAGSFIRDDYVKVVGENILEKKGRSAIRNLKTIEQQLIRIRQWLLSFKGVGKEGGKALSEIDRHISTVELNIGSGLADWVDIVPELQDRAEIAKKQEDILKSYIEELLESKKELILSKDAKKIEELKKKIGDLELDIKSLRSEHFNYPGMTISASGGGGYIPAVFAGGSFGYGLGDHICAYCHKPFQLNGDGPFSLIDTSYCGDCKKKLGLQ